MAQKPFAGEATAGLATMAGGLLHSEPRAESHGAGEKW
jgi:hypothetical protein